MPAPANLVTRYVGDDWTLGPIALTAGGAPLDMTGSVISAEVWANSIGPAAAVLTEGAGLTVAVDRTTGVITDLWVAKAVTANIDAQDRRATTYPTRIDIVVTDSRGRSRVWMIIPMLPLNRRSDLPMSA